MDELIHKVAMQGKNIIVLLEIPGAVLTPWRDAVSGIAAMFLGGQEAGSAWADVLFGDRAPEGRLPVSLPVSDEDTIQTIDGDTIVYAEGTATGYRNPRARHAFPFGHGLTYSWPYSQFEYMAPVQVACPKRPQGADDEGFGAAVVCIDVGVRNNGSRT